MIKSQLVEVYGRVQSVGFRPFVYNLANRLGLCGYVRNKTSYVEILIQGEEQVINNFLHLLKTNLPSAASIEKIKTEVVKPTVNYDKFVILDSEPSYEEFLYIPAEIKVCNDCLKELFSVEDRRYLYPFINCTQCGPRFTIIKTLPYDRKNTTMDVFKMCEECYSEYTDPSNRRFHAQPNACHRCGPGLEVKKLESEKVKKIFLLTKSAEDVKEVLEFIVKEILNGKIFAIKSYGGYHLVCDATNNDAVLRLRKSKYREYKPFAMMVSDVSVVEKYCYVNDKEKELLESIQSPIVLLEKKEENGISKYVAAKSKYYGFMLPYTPLQCLIFEWLKKYNKDIPLIMTSGNISDEPQVYKDNEAEEKFKNIVDYIVSYNRDVNIRCDDSVVMVFNNDTYFIRRSRGYSPEPIFVNFNFKKQVLSFGADLKNTFAIGKDNYVIISHHIGDLEKLEAVNSYEESIKYYIETFKVKPEVVVYDLHPLYISTKIAKEFAKKFSIISLGVQHHYAHMLSCMLEHGVFDKVIGIIFDGTGYGIDGTIWGSEFLVGDIYNFDRKGYFDYITLVGGDDGIKHAYKNLVAFLCENFNDEKFIKTVWDKIVENVSTDLIARKFDEIFNSVKFLISSNINVVKTCGMGRFFDIVAILCSVGFYNYYEGQLPQELEFLATKQYDKVVRDNSYYSYEILTINQKYVVNTKHILLQVIEDVLKNCPREKIAAKFHFTVAKICLDMAKKIRSDTNINKVVISGGVFQNMLLLNNVKELLTKNDFEVYTHKKIPTNDGGISFGQLVKGGIV